MKTENIYLVWAHPRRDSLTAHIVDEIRRQSTSRQMKVTELDLYRRNVNPVMMQEDEPDWQDSTKRYTPDVHSLFAEMQGHDTLVVVFPVWWYSFPAILKGYLDRVWNNGLAYGDGHKLPVTKIRWVALVGGEGKSFIEMGWEKNMTDYLVNMCSYLGIEDAEVTFLFDTLSAKPEHFPLLFSQVQEMVNAL
ncbi:NAD(P)H oxidoreductase [Pseudocitrobacter corydidari]|uniref:FMN-dependent NADH-azoreductase n=1 Tax=Pseudocitrobacter corydidari TaxID=2891570 RepID=A0ABY3S506_9ENTR|nr:NAD(P)H oxidoreductase [Pseudocitrobacter corydidari]UGS41193.1 FMN-dependent NADH-azoreductase [Pseudocitrobacter corydidari]